ncbi:MAG: 50S ribosomal protein L25/general stress protein Ctc [Stellaceae bacterium]
MPQITTIRAEARQQAGKGPARATRRQGLVPGILYGQKEPPVPVSLEPRALLAEMQRPGFFARLIEIELVNGGGAEKHRVLPRDVQVDPITDRPLHVDFMRIGADTTVRVEVPVVFENQALSPGLKRGGLLNVVRHEIELICPANQIPERIAINLDGLEIGDSIHIHSIGLPETVRPTIARDFTIATIAAPTAVREEQVAAAAATAAAEAMPVGAEGAAVPAATPGAAPAAATPAAAPAKK